MKEIKARPRAMKETKAHLRAMEEIKAHRGIQRKVIIRSAKIVKKKISYPFYKRRDSFYL
jgi:hypothetical protein